MTSARRVVIAGGSGFLGQNLARHLATSGYEVITLARGHAPSGGSVRHVTWDARTVGEWARYLDRAHAVVWVQMATAHRFGVSERSRS